MGERAVVTPVLAADLGVEGGEGGRMPVYVHLIELDGQRILVDTGLTSLHPALDDMDPRLSPWVSQVDAASIDVVVNTHLHADHCGGNHLFTDRPVYVQRQELDDALTQEDYTLRDWVRAPGVEYVVVDGEREIVPGVRVVPAPGHTRGSQIVVVETDDRPTVIAGDAAVWSGELDDPRSEGQLLIRALDPGTVWLSHEARPWRGAWTRR